MDERIHASYWLETGDDPMRAADEAVRRKVLVDTPARLYCR